jgi:hypothetical protein
MITIHIHLDKVHQIMVILRLWWLVKKIMSTFFVFFLHCVLGDQFPMTFFLFEHSCIFYYC